MKIYLADHAGEVRHTANTVQVRDFIGGTVGLSIPYTVSVSVGGSNTTTNIKCITLEMDPAEALQLVARLANQVANQLPVEQNPEDIEQWKEGWRQQGREDARKMRPANSYLKGKPALIPYEEGYASVTLDEIDAEARREGWDG